MNNFVENLIVTYIGAFSGHMLMLDGDGIVPFLRHICPNKSEQFYKVLDLLLSPILGTCLSFALLQPQNWTAAVYTGLTWNTTLGTINKKKIAPKKIVAKKKDE